MKHTKIVIGYLLKLWLWFNTAVFKFIINKSVAVQPQRAKTDWSGWCQMVVQGDLWLAKRLSLNLNFSFLNHISLLVILRSYPIVLLRLRGPVPDLILHMMTTMIMMMIVRYFWSVNFFSRTMHSKCPVVNLAEPTWNTFNEQVGSNMQQSIVTDI